jgi:CRP-like cAMP-binding protein
LKITHQDLSDYIAASRETVSLCLGAFKRKHLIQTQVRWLIIPDLKALRKIAET